MSLQFMIGRSGSGKSTICKRKIIEALHENPLGPALIYLVPDQMTFQSEYELINYPNMNGMIRAQVFSFSRLAWRVLQETGGISRYHLSNIGVNMLIRKVIETRKDELKLFSKVAEKVGFVTQVEQMITEFKRYCVNPEEIENLANELNSTQPSQLLLDKLHDVRIIYDEIEKYLVHKYIDSEDYLKLLAEKIDKSSYLKNAHIYIDGFHSFTPQELLVIQALMKHCGKVTITLTLDKEYNEVPHDLSLFHQTASTYLKLIELARCEGIKIEETIVLQDNFRHQFSPSLAHLEKNLETRPTKPYNKESTVHIWQAPNRRGEVEAIAREIIKHVRDNGLRYRDIALLIRNTNDYHDLIETIFTDYDIPFFIDQKKSMLHHPLIELIRSSLEIVTNHWRYDSVFRAVKTDLLFPVDGDLQTLREEMDKLENYVLAYGIKGTKWTSKEKWTYRRYRGLEDSSVAQTDSEKKFEEKINQLRMMILESLHPFYKRLKKAKTGKEMAEALFLFLEELEIPKKLEVLQQKSEQAGKLHAAREHAQVYNAVIDLLDQFVEVLGNDEISLSLFAKIMETGIEGMEFALVPPAIDQVMIANFDRSRLSHIKYTFILGVNEGIIPASPNEEGILTENERINLQQLGLQLAPSSHQQLLTENFTIYLALSSSSSDLYISYPLADEEGKALLPSGLIKRIKDLFPAIKVKVLVDEPLELSEDAQLDFIANKSNTLSYLVRQLQSFKRKYPIANLWFDVYNYYMKQDMWHERAMKVIHSLFYTNKVKPLHPEISRQLYGDEIIASVSRIEQFNRCPFSHFTKYGLGLKERQIFRLEAPDIGQLFHSALKLIADYLRKHQIEWKELTKNECEQISAYAIDQLAPRLQHEILMSSNRHYYLKRKLQKIITKTTAILSEHAKISGFAPIGLELGFGKNASLPPLSIPLDNGSIMQLVGRIDRVDKADSEKGSFLRVIDYKSSKKTLNMSEVYYGIALQMLTYLDVIITHSKNWLGIQADPAGVLYFHVHNPMLSSNGVLPEETIEEEIFKKFKMEGLVLGDEEVVRLMDKSLESGRSSVISVGIKNNGEFYSNSSIASDEEFQYLRKHIRRKFKEAGTKITNGVIDISPYKFGNQISCATCPFKQICQFDQSLEGNEYRILKQEKRDIIFEKIRKEGVNFGNE